MPHPTLLLSDVTKRSQMPATLSRLGPTGVLSSLRMIGSMRVARMRIPTAPDYKFLVVQTRCRHRQWQKWSQQPGPHRIFEARVPLAKHLHVNIFLAGVRFSPQCIRGASLSKTQKDSTLAAQPSLAVRLSPRPFWGSRAHLRMGAGSLASAPLRHPSCLPPAHPQERADPRSTK